MKKFAFAALAAIVATVSLSTVASADSRNRDDEWRRHGRHNDQGRHHDNWRNDGWRHHGHWRNHGWRNGYWGGPRIVIAPDYGDYCFVKKVRRHDEWGNAYIKRIRVCR